MFIVIIIMFNNSINGEGKNRSKTLNKFRRAALTYIIINIFV